MADLGDMAKLDHLVGQQAEGQARLSLFVCACQRDQVRFCRLTQRVGLEVLRVEVIQGMFHPSFCKPSSHPIHGVVTHLEEVCRVQIGASRSVFIHRKQDAGMGQFARRSPTGVQQLFQRGPLLIVQVHDVFQLHGSAYAILLT